MVGEIELPTTFDDEHLTTPYHFRSTPSLSAVVATHSHHRASQDAHLQNDSTGKDAP